MRKSLFLLAILVVVSACNPGGPIVDRPGSEAIIAQIESLATEIVFVPAETATSTEIPKATDTVVPTDTWFIPPTPTVTSTPTPIPTETAIPNTIQWYEAGQHIGEDTTVCGPVIAAHFAQSSQGQPIFLNIGEDYPSPTRFTVVIWGEHHSNFPFQPDSHYQGQYVCVSGLIESYNDVPEIEVEFPSQITSEIKEDVK